MFQWGVNLSDQERITQNVMNLMSIKKNEVCFDRSLGISADFIDKSGNKITSGMITELLDMVAEKEPRANISLNDMVTINNKGEYSFKAVINGV